MKKYDSQMELGYSTQVLAQVCNLSLRIVSSIEICPPGAWLIDLAQHLPQSVTLHGIDASALQFPECVVPANIRFDIMKITELPESWTSRFDFVQQRLLIGGLRASDWPLALSNYIRALKPGGYIQLVEPVSRSRDQCGPSGKRLVELQEQLFLRKGLLYDCAEQLPSLLRRAGFVEVRSEKRLGPVGEVLGPDGKVGKMVSAGSIRAMGEAMVKAELIESTDELDAIVTELEQFWEMDGGFYMAYWIVTAKTPLARL